MNWTFNTLRPHSSPTSTDKWARGPHMWEMWLEKDRGEDERGSRQRGDCRRRRVERTGVKKIRLCKKLMKQSSAYLIVKGECFNLLSNNNRGLNWLCSPASTITSSTTKLVARQEKAPQWRGMTCIKSFKPDVWRQLFHEATFCSSVSWVDPLPKRINAGPLKKKINPGYPTVLEFHRITVWNAAYSTLAVSFLRWIYL